MSAPRSNNHGSAVSRSSSHVNRSQAAPQMNRSHGGSIARTPRSQAAPQMNRSHGTPANRSAQVNRAPRANNGSVTRTPRPSNGSSMNRGPRPGNGSSVSRGPRPGNGSSVSRGPRPNHSSAIAHNNHRPGHAPAAVHHHAPVHRGPAYARPYLEPRHRPIPYHHHGYHYFGHRIHTLPIGYSVIRVGYRDYYYYDGIYYRPYWDGGYYICRPPLGTVIASTMFDVAMTTIAINTIRNEIERARIAAELSGYYAARNANYTLRTSDDYYNTNLVNQAGQNYYYQDGVFYTLQNGEYRVIEAPIGALVDEIPEDYDEIELGGKTYYQVEDTLFKPTIING
ncbi:MAG: hypothetical protein IIT92_04115, partial [Bacteroidales bacterium]|nr:hypothetical protein [Bacteroidales bacterium]